MEAGFNACVQAAGELPLKAIQDIRGKVLAPRILSQEAGLRRSDKKRIRSNVGLSSFTYKAAQGPVKLPHLLQESAPQLLPYVKDSVSRPSVGKFSFPNFSYDRDLYRPRTSTQDSEGKFQRWDFFTHRGCKKQDCPLSHKGALTSGRLLKTTRRSSFSFCAVAACVQAPGAVLKN